MGGHKFHKVICVPDIVLYKYNIWTVKIFWNFVAPAWPPCFAGGLAYIARMTELARKLVVAPLLVPGYQLSVKRKALKVGANEASA
ncbi:hypothetical protein R69619_05453 [Paraburkholderia nemoris]|nr:hypothetical protein R69619_05453 [Paraburkholderia nemoris]